jgi:serine/threonine-protein kinase
LNSSRDEVPQKVGRYVISEAIGFGAMGAVYKAFDPLIKRTIAIKTIRLDVPPQSPHYRTFIDRFYHEARISGTLSHPNIVTLYDIGETEDKVPFLAMEYVEGETIADSLNRGWRFRPEQVIGLVSQMASAIDYAHAKGVIHRDIKPSNIIVHDGEKVKITDFGIAKLVNSEITHTGSLLGTPSYMSPEQAMGESLDSRSDIFSLGVVAFEMLSGEQPFPGNNVTSILYKLVHADPVRPPNLEVLGLLPDKWHQVFSKVLSKNPSDRYGTGAEFVSELELCLGSWFGALEGETLYAGEPLAEGFGSGEPAKPVEPPERLESPEPGQPLTPPTEDGEGKKVSLGSLLGSEDEDDEDEEVIFEDATRDHPSLWGSANPPGSPAVSRSSTSSETRVDETRSKPPAGDATVQAFPTDTGRGETVRAEGLPISDDTQTVTRLPSTSGEDASSQRKRGGAFSAARSALTVAVTRAGRDGLAPLSSQLWKKRRGMVIAAGVAVALSLGVFSWILVGGKEQTLPREPAVEPTPSAVETAAPVPDASSDGGALALPSAGILLIESEPVGASVLINGNEWGLTPLEVSQVGLGSYSVRLEKKGFQPEELTAELSPDSPRAMLSVPLRSSPRPTAASARLSVSSTPPGAQVFLDGKPAGMTPLEKLRARPGKRTVRLVKEGFQPWENTVTLKAGVAESMSASLAPREPVPAPPPVAKVIEGDLVERGPDVVDPKCIECPGVGYPEMARRKKLEGSVQVSFIITETGEVQDVQVEESGGKLFDQAVIDTIKTWRHEPATKNGVRVKVRWRKRFTFRRGN